MKQTGLVFNRMFFALALMFAGAQAEAAACCGGGFGMPSMILGDEKAQFTTSMGRNEIAKDVDGHGVWHRRDTHEQTITTRFEGAHVFQDRWQAGLSIPVIQRTRGSESEHGLGDVTTQVGYEILPDWDYHPWRPKGVGSLALRIPTAPTLFEIESGSDLQARGQGLWALSAAAAFTKVFSRIDLMSSMEVHRSFGKDIANSQMRGRLEPGWGGSIAFSGGYNWSKTRLGAGLSFDYEDPLRVTGSSPSEGNLKRWATGSVSVSQMWSDEWASTVTYSDQSLFGAPLSTSLSSGLFVYLQKRWAR